ncbi:hypothetical protein KPH14_012761 [Odynerus spinipes]|uniref:Peptidase A2 domain-containing protein n=1 Tax=Odynerus spinipes TaxID=1348599 RepID=A0AAD9R8W6_9HYME|nr:hypothetical protein KPH14_012761 [Odynerus spinipes]
MGSTELSLTKLAELADWILESCIGPGVMATSLLPGDTVNETNSIAPLNSRLSVLERNVMHLSLTVEKLCSKLDTVISQNNNYRSQQKTRRMSPSTSRNRVATPQPKQSEALIHVEAVADSNNNCLPAENRLYMYDKNNNLSFLIDSGSVVTVIPRELIKTKVDKQPLTLYAANTTEISTFGEKVLTLDLGLRRQFRWPFIIAEVKSPIIGADFIAHHGILIDLKNRRLVDSVTRIAASGIIRKTYVHKKFREYMRGVRPSPTAHHNKARMFLQKNIYDCSHVHLRNDTIKPPLEPPYSGPYKVIKRLDDRRFVIDINGEHKTVAIERLKPAYVTKVENTVQPSSLDDQPIEPYTSSIATCCGDIEDGGDIRNDSDIEDERSDWPQRHQRRHSTRTNAPQKKRID